MSNTINWGKIYETTNFGNGVTDNTISWGKVYEDLVSPIGGLLSALELRSDKFENRLGTTTILEQFENCLGEFSEIIFLLEERSTYFENREGTRNILENFKNCEL